jgi:hypothetical protein
MWWQTRPGREPMDRSRFMADTEHEFGPWGKIYREDGHVIGLIQYGPASAFPRAATMPAGPPARDAVVITCAYLTDVNSPWVLQSLVLAAIGDCNDRGWPALEGFGYHYPPRESFPTRFIRHRTIFPQDFLADFGFVPSRTAGRIALMRLDLRTLESSPEVSRLERIKARLAVLQPTPAAVR